MFHGQGLFRDVNSGVWFKVVSGIFLIIVGLFFTIFAGCAPDEEKEGTKDDEIEKKEVLEADLPDLKDVERPVFVNEDELIVAARAEAEEAEKEADVEDELKLYNTNLGENDSIREFEELSLKIHTYLTPFLKSEGDYLFYPVENNELNVKERDTLERVDVLGAREGFHVEGADELVYKTPEGALDVKEEYVIYNIETGESFTLFQGDEGEQLLFSYLKEGEGVIFSEANDNPLLLHLTWKIEGEKLPEEVTSEEIVTLDSYVESIDAGFVPSLDEGVVITAREMTGETVVTIYDLQGNELYQDDFPGFDGKVYLSPGGKYLGIVTSHKGDNDSFLIDLENEEVTELPPAQELSWCPSGEKMAFFSPLREVGIYNIGEERKTLIFEY